MEVTVESGPGRPAARGCDAPDPAGV